MAAEIEEPFASILLLYLEMRRFVLLFVLLVITGSPAQASPFIFIVRHAEKAAAGGNDPELSAAGQERANALAHILKDADITAIFATEFKRTQETAAPTAKESRVDVTTISSSDTQALATKIHELNGNALVVGHGNTIPNLVKALGISIPIDIPETDYSEILVVAMGNKPELLHLHYSF